MLEVHLKNSDCNKKALCNNPERNTLLAHVEAIFVTKGTAIPLKKVFYSFHTENPNIYAILATKTSIKLFMSIHAQASKFR